MPFSNPRQKIAALLAERKKNMSPMQPPQQIPSQNVSPKMPAQTVMSPPVNAFQSPIPTPKFGKLKSKFGKF
jgi:hypothetical protein